MPKRRRFTPEFKARVALAALTGAQKRADICSQHHITSQQLGFWEKELQQSAHLIFGDPDRQQRDGRIAELERMVGRLTMQVEILKKASTLLGASPESAERWSES